MVKEGVFITNPVGGPAPSKGRHLLDKSVTEEAFLQAVMEMAQLFGWATAHFRPARTGRGWRTAVQGDGKGWPDLAAVRPPRFLFAELKSEKGKLSVAQAAWLERLRGCPGVETYQWGPRDMDAIEETLR